MRHLGRKLHPRPRRSGEQGRDHACRRCVQVLALEVPLPCVLDARARV